MATHRLFVVFAFKHERDMINFKISKHMDFVADRKIAMMRVEDNYDIRDIIGLFEDEELYACFLIFELRTILEEVKRGSDFQSEDAS